MKKLTKKDEYFIKMLNAERNYRRSNDGEDGNEPFVTPILFSILDVLKIICCGLFFFGGAILAAVIF